jgi:hypothetical protein
MNTGVVGRTEDISLKLKMKHNRVFNRLSLLKLPNEPSLENFYLKYDI